MKKVFLLSLLFLGLFACKKKKVPYVPPTADITIKMNNVVDGQAVEYGKYHYTNAAGNIYTVSLLMYYISNVVLITEDNVEVKLNNYDLMDAFQPSIFSTIEAKALPNGHYKSMRFNVGIDKDRNHSGAQDGDLDPLYAMIWTWNTGYIFMKHEGNFITGTGDTSSLQFHLGTDKAIKVVTIPIDLHVEGVNRTMNLNFDLNKMYNTPVINFNDGPTRNSTDIADLQWISDMVTNSEDAFSFVNVQ